MWEQFCKLFLNSWFFNAACEEKCTHYQSRYHGALPLGSWKVHSMQCLNKVAWESSSNRSVTYALSSCVRRAVECINFNFWIEAVTSSLMCLWLAKWSGFLHTKHPRIPFIHHGGGRFFQKLSCGCVRLLLQAFLCPEYCATTFFDSPPYRWTRP